MNRVQNIYNSGNISKTDTFPPFPLISSHPTPSAIYDEHDKLTMYKIGWISMLCFCKQNFSKQRKLPIGIKAHSQYDTSSVRVVNVMGESIFSLVKFNSLTSNFWENLTSWMLTNTGEVTFELNLSQLQCHPYTRDGTLAPASYCEPTFSCHKHIISNTQCNSYYVLVIHNES